MIVGHGGKAIVGRKNEGSANWFMGLAVYDCAANNGELGAFRLSELSANRTCRKEIEKNSEGSEDNEGTQMGACCHAGLHDEHNKWRGLELPRQYGCAVKNWSC